MAIPRNYGPVAPEAIASYSFTDISTGTGWILYYGFDSITGVGANALWHLGTNTIASQNVESTTLDRDFNLTAFNRPQTVKGTAILRFCAHTDAEYHIDATIYHVDADGNETSLGTIATITTSNALMNHVLPISLTEKQFKIGESLRLNLTTTTAGTTKTGHDPANRDGGSITPAATYPTKMELYMPFRLNV